MSYYAEGHLEDQAVNRPGPVNTSRDDEDWKTLLRMVQAGKQFLEKIKRFDMPGFRAPEAYIREMKRFGILPADFPPEAPVDPYKLDRAYPRSLWYRPVHLETKSRKGTVARQGEGRRTD